MRIVATLLLLGSMTGKAQSIAGAVLAKREPHHHLAYEDAVLRVLRVRVPAHDTTLLHEHDPDYFWVALGASTVVNAKPGVPDATITSADLSVHYTLGNFAHVARNPGATPFDNITVELLEPQSEIRNLCEPAIADRAVDCPAAAPRSDAFFSGATEHPAFSTNHTRVSVVTIPPGGALRRGAPARGTWMIALDTTDAGRGLVVNAAARWVGGVYRAPETQEWTIENRSRSPIRVIAVVKP